MKLRANLQLALLASLPLACVSLDAQRPKQVRELPIATTTDAGQPSIPVRLDWTPPALAPIAHRAELDNSFILNRTMLSVAAGLLPSSESDTRQSIRKLDGVAIHLYRFHDTAEIDPADLELLRQAYHVQGWKHLVSKGAPHTPPQRATRDDAESQARLALSRNDHTDLWLAVDGMEVRGGTLLYVTPRTISLVTFAGDLNPIDVLHLRGHFGIPSFAGSDFTAAQH